MLSKEKTVSLAEGFANEDFFCSESVLMAISNSIGVESELIPRIATGFGAGVARYGELCGALSGGIIGLGICFGRSDPSSELDREPYWYAGKLLSKFKEVNGEVSCQGLLGLDLAKPEDYERYQEEKMWAKICSEYIKKATQLAYEVIEEEKRRTMAIQ